jgi:cyclophilin family peptidyl-prolyl cis-trans isomerase
MSKRRRGSRQAPPRKHNLAGTTQVSGKTQARGIPGVPLLALGGIAVVAVIAAIFVFRPGGIGGASPSASPSSAAASASASAGASGAGSPVAAGDCPTNQPPALPAGQTRTVTLQTEKGPIAIKVEAHLSPIAAGNFVALSSCGFYDGTVFHRTPTLQDGTPFVIQGGDGQYGKAASLDPALVGTGGPGYTITDESVTTPYKRGTVAMARSSQPNSVGSQFFIVLDDKDGAVLGSANTYQIIGNVTSGMEAADAIFAASAGVELPTKPVEITTVTVANP